MVSAMATPTIFLLFCFFGFRIISATTHPGDAAALRKLRQIWKNTPPSWSDSEDPCGSPWDGIACANSRVVKLTLPSAGLEGTLSDDIGQLSDLESLDLSFNGNLTGPIPPAIGNLQKLKKLALPGCSFSGNIPPEISNMTNIESIFLSSNNLTGGIPPSIGRLANLRGLDVGDNHLSGPLPVSSGSTPGLDQLLNTEHFHFNKNQLSGSIPENLFNSNMSLIHLILDGNNFTGPIPVSIGLLQNLTVLRLSRNALTGAVPPSIRNLTRLKELNLAGNGFTGDVPDFTGMTALKYVDLSGNLFTPSLAPSWIFRLRSLTVLIMEYGGLIGGVPTEIFSLPQLQELILRNNKFNGTVDFGTAVGASLRFVDLRSNIITGMLNEPRVNSTTIRLRENPVCNAQIEKKDICQPEQETEKYSTVSACTKKCLVGQGNRPGSCNCAQPYAGTLSFGGPLLRDLRDSTRFQRLEGDLAGKLKLENGSVSLLNPVFDDDEYLHIRLELFPSDGDFFNRSEVQRLAFALSTQVYQPHDDEWGPYVFEGEIYIFGSGEPQGTSAAVIGGIAAGCVVLVAGLIAIGISAVRERRIAQRAKRITNPFAHWATNDEDAGSAPQLNGVRFISFSDVKKCTDGFSDENEIGVGGYGQVYKGKLPNGQMVAIKRAKQGSMQGALEFKTEIELLSRVHHTNLVRLVGFCYEKGEQMLIYEYIPNGTLGESLSGKLGIHLSWIDRLRIALGSARGLAYLHELADPPIIHRDVKTANILLDERLRPKVADFGLSKLVEDAAKTNAQTAVKGTRGYLDPEYYATQRLTDKSDVYSFGVVMLELLTGKRPIERNRYIVREVATALKSPDGLKEVVDPVIQNAPVLVGLEMFVGLAMRCVENYSEDRPTMRDVVKELEFILETNGGLFSRATSMASSLGEIRGLAARSRRSESLSSTEISSNAFDRIAAAYSLPTTVVPK